MQTITAQLETARTKRPVAGPFLNLLRKEWGAARASILAGACIFGLVPLIWGLVYLSIDFGEPAVPFGLTLLTLAGWLYALVIGANTVCRDWGRAEEQFLLARPVTPRMVIAAKLFAGLAVVTIAWAAAMLCDLLSFALPIVLQEGQSEAPATALSFLLLPLFGLAVSYLLAFAAAVITRQTLSATLLAGLALFVWAAAPLALRPLFFLHPEPGSASRAADNGLLAFCEGNWRFLLTVGIVVAAALAASFLASTREHRLNLGYKPLAWTIAVVVLLLFVGATTEVGNSLTVLDRRAIPDPPADDVMGVPVHGDFMFASDGRRCFGMSKYGAYWSDKEKKHSLTERRLVSFEVTDRRRIENLRSARLFFSSHPESFPDIKAPIQQTDLRWMTHVADFAVNSAGEMVLTGAALGVPAHVMRVRISWPPRQQPQVSSVQLAAPERQPWNSRYFLLRYATTDKYAFAEYGIRPAFPEPDKRDNPATWEKILCKYEWSPEPELETHLEPVATYQSGSSEYLDTMFGTRSARGKLLTWYRAVLHESSQGESTSVYASDFVLDDDLNAPLWALRSSQAFGKSFLAGFGPPGWIEWIPRGDLAVASDRSGLRIFKVTGRPGEEPELVGEYRASLLTMLLRGQTRQLALLPSGRLAEISGQTLTLYDVSDPTQARRIGFYNLSPLAYAGDVFAVGNFLVVRQVTSPGLDELLVLNQPGTPPG